MGFKIGIYLLLFASIVYAIYLALPKKARPFCLLAFSILFYVIYSKFLTIFLLLTILTVYFGGIAINKFNDKFALQKQGLEKEDRKKLKQKFNRKKFWVVFCVILVNLAFIGVLKYFNFFGSIFEGFFSWFNVTIHWPVLKIALPLGISYYTLTAIGYLVDVNRGKYRAGNFWQVALFIGYFPQLYEGPFARFDQLSPQLWEGKGFDANNFYGGLLSILWGFFKKMVIADRLAIIATEVFSNYAQYNGIIILLGIVLFTIQLYAEFSGIIDIASGVSELFGIKLAKNFNQPFFSRNVGEFWRRWHISLGAWLKDYIFYPVSMSRGITKLNKKMQKLNSFMQLFITSSIALLAVWLTNGLWHGAGAKYIVYGMYYYVLMLVGLCCEPLFAKIYKKMKINKDSKPMIVLSFLKTFVLVNLGMLIFRANSLTAAVKMFGGIFTGGQIDIIRTGIIDCQDFIMCFVTIAILFAVDIIKEKNINIKQWFLTRKTALKLTIVILILVLIVVFGAYGNGYVPPDPIYGAF